MSDHHKPEIDPRDLKDSQDMWNAFVAGGKYIIILSAAILIGLALGFIKFT